MTLHDRLNQIIEKAEELKAEALKFETEGNNAAGTRLRVGMQDIKQYAQAVRVEVQNTRKAKA